MEIYQSNVRGVVKLYRPSKGYGFIVDASGQDYFVHVSDVAEGAELARGDRVVFNSTQGERGWRALAVRVKQKQAAEVPPSKSGAGSDSNPRGQQTPTNDAGDPDRGLAECPSCKGWVRPRVVVSSQARWMDASRTTETGFGPGATHSVCPLCGARINTFSRTESEVLADKATDLAPMIGLIAGVVIGLTVIAGIVNQFLN